MIGSLITRGLVMMFGYAYPAYECYKTVEMNKPDIEQLRFWCQYWILVAMITVCEKIGDTFVGWLPMYGETKLVFFIYLWYPKTKGTSYVYDAFFKPYVAKHETEIDRNLSEMRTRAGDMVVSYCQKAAGYGHTRIFQILQYIASQSTPTQPSQPQQLVNRLQKPDKPSIHGSVSSMQPNDVQIPSASKQLDDDNTSTEVNEPPENRKDATAPTTSNEPKTTSTATASLVLASKASSSTEERAMQIDKDTSSKTDETAQTTPRDVFVVGEKALRVTRARSKRIPRGTNPFW